MGWGAGGGLGGGRGGAGRRRRARRPATSDRSITLGFRADSLAIRRGTTANGFAASVIYTEYLGDNAYVYARLADGTQISVRTSPTERFDSDETVAVEVRPEGVHFFARENGRRLAI